MWASKQRMALYRHIRPLLCCLPARAVDARFRLEPAAANGDCFLVQRYGELIDMFNAPVDPNTTNRTYQAQDGRFYRAWSLPEVNEIFADNGITEEHIDRFDAGECR